MANLVSVIGQINHEAVSFKDSVCAWALRMAVCGWSLGLQVEIGRHPSDVIGIIETALGSIRASVQCRITGDNGRVGCKKQHIGATIKVAEVEELHAVVMASRE